MQCATQVFYKKDRRSKVQVLQDICRQKSIYITLNMVSQKLHIIFNKFCTHQKMLLDIRIYLNTFCKQQN